MSTGQKSKVKSQRSLGRSQVLLLQSLKHDVIPQIILITLFNYSTPESTQMQDNSVMLQIDNLTKQYEHILAVNNLSFHVNRGEIFGLLGSNGAGKTTTLHVIAGLLKPTEGKVAINGLDIREHSLKIKSIMGYLPESPAVYERLTGREFLNFIGRIRGMSENKIKNRVNQLAKILELEDRINSRLALTNSL